MNEITYKFDIHNPPPLTQEQQDRLNNLSKMPDSEIDFSDIPPIDEEKWKNAISNPFFKIKKEVISTRIDVDVLEWLKSYGKGYQARLNKILRLAMVNDLQHNH